MKYNYLKTINDDLKKENNDPQATNKNNENNSYTVKLDSKISLFQHNLASNRNYKYL